MVSRNIVTVILLSIITCGIYALYWVYTTAEALDKEGNNSGSMSPALCLILCIFTGIIGYLIFGIMADQNLNSIKDKRGIPTTDNKVIYMLSGFLFPILLIYFVQNEINMLTADSE